MKASDYTGRNVSRLFLGAFALSCMLFWWLPDILFRLIGLDDSVENWGFRVTILGLITFAAGYSLPPVRYNAIFSGPRLDACEALAYKATVWLAFPALVLAVQFFFSRSGLEYGQGDPISLLHQSVLYGHMFLAFLFLGAAKTIPQNRRRIIIASILVTLPRFIICLRWGRFFLAQAVLPVLLIALARGWVAVSAKRLLQFCALALFIVFVPAFTRGDNFLGQDEVIKFFQAGSSLRLFQDNRDLNLAGLCPPLLVSMSAKLVPYSMLGVCTMEFKGVQGVPATLDRILTDNDPANEDTGGGSGSNYLLELYLSGGIGAIIVGSLLFGFTSRCFLRWVSERSLFAGIWAECLSRALLAPRSTLGYVFERIPSLALATIVFAAVAPLLYFRVQAWPVSRGVTLQAASK